MKTIFTTRVNGIELRFTSKGLDLDPNHDLYDETIRATYAFGQALHPLIIEIRNAKGLTSDDAILQATAHFHPNGIVTARNILCRAKGEFIAKQFEPSYIYLVKNDHELYKIGRTKELARRMKRFDVKLPFPVEVIAVIETYEPVTEEKLWHERFAHKRIDGEWFALDADDVAWMQQFDVRYTVPSDETPEPTPDPTSHLWEYGDRSNG